MHDNHVDSFVLRGSVNEMRQICIHAQDNPQAYIIADSADVCDLEAVA